MNPIRFALTGAVLLTTSLFAFDTFGQGGPSVPAEAARVEQPAAQAAVAAGPAEGLRRPVRVILSSPYGRQG